jgi:hypothetical protein
MSKSAKKRTVISSATSGPVARPAVQTAADSESTKGDPYLSTRSGALHIL